MNDFEQLPELTHSPNLRDTIFEHLPTQARAALMGVEVKFFPNEHGEMELLLRYDPTSAIVDIDAIEGIYGPAEEGGHQRLTGYLVKACELNPDTAEVLVYETHLEPYKRDRAKRRKDLEAEEWEASRFTAIEEGFLISLFNSL